MDAQHFDTLTRALSEPGSRRGLLAILASLPVLGGFFTLLDRDETEAKGRRKRRKKAHKHGKGRDAGKKKPQKCKPHATAKTCTGKCGPVKNTCKKTVDCGSCDCDPACDDCFTCQGALGQPGTCVLQDSGAPCGEASCDNGEIIPQGSCDGSGACQAGTPVSCSPYTQCAGNACATTCTDDDGCVDGDVCCSGSCEACCDSGDCSGATPICVENTCQPCQEAPEFCPGSRCCDADNGECVGTCPASAPICGADNVCICAVHADCGEDALCVDGQCHACDVVDGENLASAIAAAANGATLYVCAGAYASDVGIINIGTSLLLVGAGQGGDGTVIQSTLTLPALAPAAGSRPVTLRTLRIQNASRGVLIGNARQLTMTDCTVRDNGGTSGGGIENGFNSVLEMTRCTVENNSFVGAVGNGGGLRNDSGTAMLTDCLFQGNTATRGGGIYNEDLGGVLTLIRTQVALNTASNGGSGIFNANNGTVTLQEDSAVCANIPTTDQCQGFADPGGACKAVCPGK